MTNVKKPEDARSLQDVFDLAVTRVLRNRRPAYVGDDCAYRTPRGKDGHRSVCAVGALIPAHLYSARIEGRGIGSVIWARPEVLPGNIHAIPGVRDFLIRLQAAHDEPARRWHIGICTKQEFKADFLERCRRVANQFNLDPSVAAG